MQAKFYIECNAAGGYEARIGLKVLKGNWVHLRRDSENIYGQ